MSKHRVLTFKFVNYIVMKMNASYIVFISALLIVDVSSECDNYIDCFSEFLHEFFNTNATDVKKHEGTVEILDEKSEDLDKIIDGLTVLIKNIDVNIKEHDTKKDENNKTKIHVKVFEIGDILEKDYTTEIITDDHESTTEYNLAETSKDLVKSHELLQDNVSVLPFESTTQVLNVIPVHSDEDNEISSKDDFYDVLDDNSTDYPGIDYIELYKDTTNENIDYISVDYIPTEPAVNLGEAIKKKEQDVDNLIEESLNLIQDEVLNTLLRNITSSTTESCHGDKMLVSSAVFPWIATIFLKNESNGYQYNYFCDGALMSEKVVLTAARCVYNNTLVINPENFLIILGKTSLQVSSGSERILKVAAVKPHENFTTTDDNAANDLAMLVLEEPATLNDAIETACLQNDDKIDDGNDTKEAFTTAWSLPGDLTLVYFDKEKSKACGSENKVENTFCATYGNDVALCPSYGGLYVTISADHLYLQGLRTGNPQDRGICYDKNVTYTSLKNHHIWIQDIVEANK